MNVYDIVMWVSDLKEQGYDTKQLSEMQQVYWFLINIEWSKWWVIGD